jgi:hypothetical protein
MYDMDFEIKKIRDRKKKENNSQIKGKKGSLKLHRHKMGVGVC